MSNSVEKKEDYYTDNGYKNGNRSEIPNSSEKDPIRAEFYNACTDSDDTYRIKAFILLQLILAVLILVWGILTLFSAASIPSFLGIILGWGMGNYNFISTKIINKNIWRK